MGKKKYLAAGIVCWDSMYKFTACTEVELTFRFRLNKRLTWKSFVAFDEAVSRLEAAKQMRLMEQFSHPHLQECLNKFIGKEESPY